MRSALLSDITAALLALGGTLVAIPLAAEPVPVVPWIDLAPAADKVLPDLAPSLAQRPAILLETDYYAYGPDTGFTAPNLTLTIDDNDYASAVNLYLYWQNRETEALLYYSLATGQFDSQERDLFGSPGAPARVLTPALKDFQLFGPGGALGPLPESLPSATGRYQFVFEIRHAESGQPMARGNAMYNFVDGVETHSGNKSSSEIWSNDRLHILSAPVHFFSPAVLTIEPGTVILSSQASAGTLVIRQGARIHAAGTPKLPIILSSELPVGQRSRGDWGGLVISGFAPTNQFNPIGVGNSGPYGGNDPNDDSGILRFLRIEFAGIRFDQSEINGLALQGVGRGTIIDHVQVHHDQDDGIEFFGGTVDARYVLITGASDDSLDWNFGWQGRMQHLVVVQNVGRGDRCIEADNFEANPDAFPRSNPMIANATLISNAGLHPFSPSEVIRLRRGTGGNITHAIVAFGPEEGVRLSEDETFALLGTELQVRNSFFYEHAVLSDSPVVIEYLEAPAQGNSTVDAQLINPQSPIQPDVAPLAGSPARTVGPLPEEFRNDPFFRDVTYAGGVEPDDPWIEEGWVTYSDN